jgi:hypothetical protein
MYGAGGGAAAPSGGAGFQGVVAVRYSGGQAYNGGNHITYNSADSKTYHVFTASGTLSP